MEANSTRRGQVLDSDDRSEGAATKEQEDKKGLYCQKTAKCANMQHFVQSDGKTRADLATDSPLYTRDPHSRSAYMHSNLYL